MFGTSVFFFFTMSTKSVNVQGLTSLLETLKVGDGNASSLVQALEAEPKLAESMCASLAEQAALTGKGADALAAANACKAFEALANSCITIAEPYLVSALPVILVAGSNKDKNVRTNAAAACTAIGGKISVDAVRRVLPMLFAASENGQGHSTRVLALNMIASFSDHAPEQLSYALPDVVPAVTSSMSEPKKEVAKAAHDAMVAACDVIGNRDIEHMTSKIVRSIVVPSDVPEIMHSLAGVTFVQSVTAPALAMVVPLLLRGLRSTLLPPVVSLLSSLTTCPSLLTMLRTQHPSYLL